MKLHLYLKECNSSGRQLTMVDLMCAATWKGGFDLNDAIDKVMGSL